MWPLLVAAGVYMICRGIQDGIDSNRGQNQKQLPPLGGNDPARNLRHHDYDLLEEDDWKDGNYGK